MNRFNIYCVVIFLIFGCNCGKVESKDKLPRKQISLQVESVEKISRQKWYVVRQFNQEWVTDEIQLENGPTIEFTVEEIQKSNLITYKTIKKVRIHGSYSVEEVIRTHNLP